MAYYRRGYRRRFRLGRRYRRRLYRRSYARRYVNASSRSSIRMKCNQTVTSTLAAGYGPNAASAGVYYVYPYDVNGHGSLVTNPLYQAYLNLYEETKLIGMKLQLSVTSVVGDSTTPSLQIYTAWDRRHGYGEAAYSVTDIKNAANSTVATALNNNVAKLSRSIYASDLMEKAQWHDSSLNAAGNDEAWVTAANNPNFFCPAFFLFFNSPSLGAAHNIAFSLSITYYVAFRNPKYGGSSSSKDLPARVVTFADGDAGDDMDEIIVSPRASAADLARIEQYRYIPDEPAGAARAAAADMDAEPAPLERRQRSAASQAAGSQPIRKKKNV